jgi:thiosulfate/3-mercaptopyruvate sulfurtransferase
MRVAGQLLDARAAPRYRGDVEPLDRVGGHVPGALNRPFADNLDSDGRFKSAAQLRDEFVAVLGSVDDPSTSCTCAVPA